jgi:hypothetical protein
MQSLQSPIPDALRYPKAAPIARTDEEAREQLRYTGGGANMQAWIEANPTRDHLTGESFTLERFAQHWRDDIFTEYGDIDFELKKTEWRLQRLAPAVLKIVPDPDTLPALDTDTPDALALREFLALTLRAARGCQTLDELKPFYQLIFFDDVEVVSPDALRENLLAWLPQNKGVAAAMNACGFTLEALAEEILQPD